MVPAFHSRFSLSFIWERAPLWFLRFIHASVCRSLVVFFRPVPTLFAHSLSSLFFRRHSLTLSERVLCPGLMLRCGRCGQGPHRGSGDPQRPTRGIRGGFLEEAASQWTPGVGLEVAM